MVKAIQNVSTPSHEQFTCAFHGYKPFSDMASVIRKKKLHMVIICSNFVNPYNTALSSPLQLAYACSTEVVFLAAHAISTSLPYCTWLKIAENPCVLKSVERIKGLTSALLLKSYTGNALQGLDNNALFRSSNSS